MTDDLTDVAKRVNTPDELIDPVPLSAGYTSMPWLMGYTWWQKRPPFSLHMAEQMLTDHQVGIGLKVGNGPLLKAEVTAEGSGAVCEFALAQWQRIWDTSAASILRAKEYGYMAYEVMYKERKGRIEFDQLLDRHPMDTRPITIKGQLRAVRLTSFRRATFDGTGVGPQNTLLVGMKGLWLTYDERFGNRFGRSILLGAYAPWYEKVTDHGAYDMLRLWMFKNCAVGDVLKYPAGEIMPLPDGRSVSARDVAREIMDLRMSGAAIALDSSRDPVTGHPKWEYQAPANAQSQAPILDALDHYDDDIFDGLLVPREVIEASETGSGFSGRSIPFISFLAIRDVEFGSYVRQIKAQIIDKLVALNFGLDAARAYELKPVPLLETVGEQMGGMGQPNTQSQGGGAMLQQLMQRRQQQQGGGGGDDENLQFATVEDEPRTRPRDRRAARRSIDAGAALADDVRSRIDTLLKKKA